MDAIEKQAELEDTIAATKFELDGARARVRTLENEKEEHERLLLTQKRDVDIETETLTKKLMDERGQRISAEGSRKEIEKELEDLTRSLFEEANKMVAVERVEKAALQERNDHLTTQLKDTEVLLASHQAQLEELKVVMQKMSSREEEARPDSPNPARGHAHRYSRDSMKGIKTPLTGSFPSPVVSALENSDFDENSRTAQTSPEIQAGEDPEQFAGMLMPRYRTDIIAYNDFLSLLHFPRAPGRPVLSRAASTSSLGTSTTGAGQSKDTLNPRHHLNTPDRVNSPNMGGNNAPTASGLWNRYSDLAESKKEKETPLSSTKFMKRALLEDIEPTLRLDQAPELGYLSRRSILNAVIEGHLIVEPMPAYLARYQPERAPCALCGDARYTAQSKRNFRLKTSERTDSQPYPLCDWCTDRVRSVCTYVAFLKQVKDGLWKASNESDELRVWEEGVRLREGMFWSRVGHIVD